MHRYDIMGQSVPMILCRLQMPPDFILMDRNSTQSDP